jgi:hypothetical protein
LEKAKKDGIKMAELSKSVIGNLSGTLGDVVFHQKNGKVFVRRRPKAFIPGNDPKSVERRSRFAFSAKLARAIYAIPEVRMVWQEVVPHGRSVYHFITGTNTNLVKADSVTDRTVLVPGGKNLVNCTSAFINSDRIIVQLTPASGLAEVSRNQSFTVKLAYVLCMCTPIVSSNDLTTPPIPGFCFFAGSSGVQSLSYDVPMTFSVPLSSNEIKDSKRYEDKKLLGALLIFTNENEIAVHSETFVQLVGS